MIVIQPWKKHNGVWCTQWTRPGSPFIYVEFRNWYDANSFKRYRTRTAGRSNPPPVGSFTMRNGHPVLVYRLP